MIKTILIDLDDTLWDTKNNNKDSLEELYIAHDGDRVYGSFSRFFTEYWPYNESLWDLYRKGIIDKQTLTIERLRRFVEPLGFKTEEEILAFNEKYLSITKKKSGVVPGAIELLEHLKPLYKLVVLSNGFEEVQTEKMASAGLLPYIDYIVLSEKARSNKPNVEIFKYAMNVSHSRREECIMIGDSLPADIEGAINFGIPSIWFNPEGLTLPPGMDPNDQKSPIYEVKKLSEIPPILTSLRPFTWH